MDSLRAICALSVFVFHAALEINHLSRPVAQLDAVVPVFFAISAFLLYRPYVQARLHGLPSPTVVPYAIRRVARIVPGYWLALVIIAIWLGLSDVLGVTGFLKYMFFGQIYDPLAIQGGVRTAWTLCIEVTFYLMLPVWAFLLRKVSFSSTRSFVWTEAVPLSGLILVTVAWRAATVDLAPAFGRHLSPAAFTMPAYLDDFALGMLMAVASVVWATRERQPGVVRLVERQSWIPWAIAAAAFVLCVRAPGALGDGGTVDYVGRHALKGLIAVALIAPAIYGDAGGGLVRKLLANRTLLWIGLVAYGFYLWHYAVLVKLTDYGFQEALGGPGFVAVALGVSLAIAAASWYVLERRAIRSGAKRARDIEKKQIGAARQEPAHAGVEGTVQEPA
jgi:peptidoglycan/LPS O-acetylase OafA/YrhL